MRTITLKRPPVNILGDPDLLQNAEPAPDDEEPTARPAEPAGQKPLARRTSPPRKTPKGADDQADREPHDQQAEQAVLGAVLGRPDECLAAVRPLLTPETFWREVHGNIFTTILQVADEGGTLCPATVAAAMPPDPELPEAAAREYLDRLLYDWGTAGGGITGVEAGRFAARVADCGRRRRLAELGERLTKEALAGRDVDRVLAEMDEARFLPTYGEQGMDEAEFLSANFGAIRWVVPNILPEGLTVFGARPKAGKSLLVLQLAQAVATGGHFLGQTPERRRVLILSLEDNKRRVQERARQQGWLRPLGESMARFEFASSWTHRGTEGAKRLVAAIRSGKWGCVIVDTLSRLLKVDDWDKYGLMTAELAGIQEAAITSQTAVVAIHHHKKTRTQDPIDDALGSTAISAVADTLWGLYRVPSEPTWKLHIRGRDTIDQELDLRRDDVLLSWFFAESADRIKSETLEEDVFDVLAESGAPMTAAQVGAALKLRGNEQKRPNIVRALSKLVAKQVAQRDESLPGGEQRYSLRREGA